MGKAIGIDLGTTNSVMAIFSKGQAETIENVAGTRLTPSVVSQDQYGERLVGDSAKGQAVLYPENTIFSVKRFMGRNFRDPDVQQDIKLVPYRVTETANGGVEVWMGGKAYSPSEISSFILAAMKQEAEEQFGEEVTHAVITVPAYFGQLQKDATRTAGQLAGLEVMRIIPEPTAAALAYGIKAQSGEPQTLLVYDLGGGTFDVTVLFVAGGVFADVTKTGHNHLGGDDFDQAIINHIITQTQRQHRVDLHNNREALQKLKVAAEKAKVELSKRPKVRIVVPAITQINGRNLTIDLELTRPEYEQMIRPYVQETINLVRQAIREAEYQPEDIDHILLAGGSTLTPLVVDSLRREFGEEKVLRGVNPMECVAQGAAVQTVILGEPPPPPSPKPGKPKPSPEMECTECGRSNPIGQSNCWNCGYLLKPDITVSTSTAIPLGIQTEGDKMEIIVQAGTFFPTTEPITHRFYTAYINQTFVRVPVYEGNKEVASQNEYLGEAQGQLPPDLPKNTEVAVSFNIDRDGILYVTAQLPDHPGVKVEATIDRKNRQGAGSKPPHNSGLGDLPPLRSWQDEAQATLNMAGFILAQGRRYIEPRVDSQLQGLAIELQRAISDDNEALTRRKMEALEQALNNLGPITLLVFAEAIAGTDMVSSSEGSRLTALVQQAQRTLAANNGSQFNQVLAELDALMSQIMGRLQQTEGPAAGMAGGGLLGLLRSSSH